jgi:hypothetical protein
MIGPFKPRIFALKPLAVITLALCAGPSFAQDYVTFRSPTGNIGCAIYLGDYAVARCDLLELTPSYRDRPADCDLDWGSAFAVGPVGRGEVACVGDTVFDPGASILDYGQEIRLGPFTCASAETGVTCTNAEGHGFSVRRAEQRVF